MRPWIAATVLAAACAPPGYDKHASPDASTTDGHATHDGTPATGDAGADSPPGVCNQPFRLDGHASSASVWLTGDFIAWGGDPANGVTTLTLGNDGVWTGTRAFTAGDYQYKFIVDSSMWIVDPGNPNQIDDGFGGKNSVYSCVP